MAKVLVTESSLASIGNAIRGKTGENTMYKPSEMAAAINSIPSYPEPTGSVTITKNGTVNVKDKASAIVNVPNSYDSADEGKVVSGGTLVEQTSRNVTENGAYDTTENNEVVVAVSASQPNLQSKTVTQNGTVTPDSGYNGLSSVVVNVSGGGSVLLMNQGQVSTMSDYATANFDSGVDLTAYDRLIVDMYRGGRVVGSCAVIPSSLPQTFSVPSRNYTYKMELTANSIACTQYSGDYVNLYVNVYGVDV